MTFFKKSYTFIALLLLTAATVGVAQQDKLLRAKNLYDIIYKGTTVSVDGDLRDWKDAPFLYFASDSVYKNSDNVLYNSVYGPYRSPLDFSGSVAIKMDDQNIYLAVHVRDGGVPLITTPSAAPFTQDHVSLYLGLWDMKDSVKNTHTKLDTVLGRYHKIWQPDYQLALRALPYATAGDPNVLAKTFDPINNGAYNYGYVDSIINKTTVGVKVWSDGQGYDLEWKIPFSSLAGKIAKQTSAVKDSLWPVFTPKNGMVISFDMDLTDNDAPADAGGATQTYIRMGPNASLWRDAFNFGWRGRITDATIEKPFKNSYRIPLNGQAVTIDGSLKDWSDARFIGAQFDSAGVGKVDSLSQTLNAGGGWFIQQVTKKLFVAPKNPNDFSGWLAIKMDNNNMYVAAHVRDEGIPMITTPDPNPFNQDHVSMYAGLFDIKNNEYSTHTVKDTVLGRFYKIFEPDFQIALRALPYAAAGDPNTMAKAFDAVNRGAWNGGYVDSLVPVSTIMTKIWPDGKGWDLEWKVPFSSLAGKIGKQTSAVKDSTWPLFIPMHGKVIPFDFDITDNDVPNDAAGAKGSYLRFGQGKSLWRDAFMFGNRGIITDVNKVGATDVNRFRVNAAPRAFELEQNFPNPFNPATTIRFSLPLSQKVSLSVYNVLGQKVAELLNETMPAGTNQVSWNASHVASGLYLYELRAGSFVETRKMMLLK